MVMSVNFKPFKIHTGGSKRELLQTVQEKVTKRGRKRFGLNLQYFTLKLNAAIYER